MEENPQILAEIYVRILMDSHNLRRNSPPVSKIYCRPNASKVIGFYYSNLQCIVLSWVCNEFQRFHSILGGCFCNNNDNCCKQWQPPGTRQNRKPIPSWTCVSLDTVPWWFIDLLPSAHVLSQVVYGEPPIRRWCSQQPVWKHYRFTGVEKCPCTRCSNMRAPWQG